MNRGEWALIFRKSDLVGRLILLDQPDAPAFAGVQDVDQRLRHVLRSGTKN